MRYLFHESTSPAAYAALLAMLCGLSVGCGPPQEPPDFRAPQLEARVSLLNKTHEMHVLRVRNLRPDVQLDCERVRTAPERYLRDDAFEAPVRWALYSDQEIGLGIDNQQRWNRSDDLGGRRCSAALVQSDTVPDIVVFWDDTLEPKRFTFDPNIPEHIKPDPQTVVLHADYSETPPDQIKPYRFRPCGENAQCSPQQEANAAQLPDGARYEWESHYDRRLHFERPWRPVDQPDEQPEECQMPGGENSLAWSNVPSGIWTVDDVSEGIDGCHTLHLQNRANSQDTFDFLICVPFEALRSARVLSDYPTITVEFRLVSASSHQGLQLVFDTVTDDGRPGPGAQLYAVAGESLPPAVELDLEHLIRSGCEPVEAGCGQVDTPVDLIVKGPQDVQQVRAGEAALPTADQARLFVMRSLARSVVDTRCEEDPVSSQLGNRPGYYLEAVAVIRD